MTIITTSPSQFLEFFNSPASVLLNGEAGSNREMNARCQIKAKNDYEALQCWLNEYRHKATTFRTYQKEAERFLLWAIFQIKKPLSSLDRDDLETYIHFLDDPQPKEKWCGSYGGRLYKRGDANWRPFTGPLSHSAKITAVSIIDSLLNYLVDARYLAFNPLSLMRKKHLKSKHINASEIALQERMLTIDEWHTMLEVLENFPETTLSEINEKARLNFLVNILYFLGLRINELATHNWNAFRKIDEQWWFYVFGKGDKLGRIPVNDEFLRAIILYRAHLKLTPFPSIDETTPLIVSFTTKEAITPRQINKILKRLAIETSKRFDDQPEKVKKIQKFSAHWLRHLSASMQDRAGIEFKHIRANHRHENDETTRRYVHAIDQERHQDMQKLSLRKISIIK
ncbi:MAG: tyrosine-type recombinase/integrase [Gammaproteobacteria bacterium]